MKARAGIVVFSILIVLVAAGCATTPFQPRGINEIPMYGGGGINEVQKAANEKFIAGIKNSGISLEDGSKQAVTRGWQYLRQHDYSTSMKRFNQAWLLNPKNPDIFWGFGNWYGYQEKYDEAEKMFKLGLELKEDHSGILYDLAFTYNNQGIKVKYSKTPEGADRYFEKALPLLEKASALKPKWGDLYSTWSASLMQLKRYSEALEKAEIGKEFGGRLEPGYIEFLKSQIKKEQ